MLILIKTLYTALILPPSSIIIILLIYLIYLRKKYLRLPKILLGITILLYFISIPMTSGFLIRTLEGRFSQPKNVKGDVIVMLCGGAVSDVPNTFGQGNLSGSSANRLLTSLQLSNKLNLPVIISGGEVTKESGNEAETAERVLKDIGIGGKRIIIENKSRNTTQNAIYSKKLIKKYKFKHPILVTSAFHMYRAEIQFKKAGVSVIPYPTDYFENKSYKFKVKDIIPSADALYKISTAAKEYVGIMASKWY